MRPFSTLLLLGFGAFAGCQADRPRIENTDSSVQSAPVADAAQPTKTTDTLALATTPPGNAAYLNADTLRVVSTDPTVRYPFGRVAQAAVLTKRYPLFTVQKGVSYYRGDTIPMPYTLLRFRNSGVKFNDDSEKGAASVIAGHIVDPEIILDNGLRLGKTLPELLRAYFVAVPPEKVHDIHTVRVDYVVDDSRLVPQ